MVRVILLLVLCIPADALPPPGANAAHADIYQPLPAPTRLPRLDVHVPAPNTTGRRPSSLQNTAPSRSAPYAVPNPHRPTIPNPTHIRTPYHQFPVIPPARGVSTPPTPAPPPPPAPTTAFGAAPGPAQASAHPYQTQQPHTAQWQGQYPYYAAPAPAAAAAEPWWASAPTPAPDGAWPFSSSSAAAGAYPNPGDTTQWGEGPFASSSALAYPGAGSAPWEGVGTQEEDRAMAVGWMDGMDAVDGTHGTDVSMRAEAQESPAGSSASANANVNAFASSADNAIASGSSRSTYPPTNSPLLRYTPAPRGYISRQLLDPMFTGEMCLGNWGMVQMWRCLMCSELVMPLGREAHALRDLAQIFFHCNW
jgi:hypothetical protein